jgi:hypothetical protein
VRAGEGGGEHIGQRAHVATGGVGAVVEAGQENLVTVGVNVAEVVLLDFLERGHRQAEQDGVDECQQRGVEGRGQTAGDADKLPSAQQDDPKKTAEDKAAAKLKPTAAKPATPDTITNETRDH